MTGKTILFFPHCKMEPAWGRDFAFAVDVSETYAQKQAALMEYGSIFRAEGDPLLEGSLYGRGCAYGMAARRALRRNLQEPCAAARGGSDRLPPHIPQVMTMVQRVNSGDPFTQAATASLLVS